MGHFALEMCDPGVGGVVHTAKGRTEGSFVNA